MAEAITEQPPPRFARAACVEVAPVRERSPHRKLTPAAKNMAVPAILGIRFINQHVEAFYPRWNKVHWARPLPGRPLAWPSSATPRMTPNQ